MATLGEVASSVDESNCAFPRGGWHYEVCGFVVRSSRRLPGLRVSKHCKVDINIDVGGKRVIEEIQRMFPGDRFVRSWKPHDVALSIDDFGTLRMTPGRLEVGLKTSQRWNDMVPYVLGTGLAVSMFQLSAIPHHVSAISLENQAIAFTGPSGAGKSTFATAWLRFCKARLVSDDSAVIDTCSHGDPLIFPGVSRLKLCSDSLLALLEDQRGRVGRSQWKHDVQGFLLAERPCRLRAMVLLDDGGSGDRRLVRVTGRERVDEWMKSVHRREYGVAVMGLGPIMKHVLRAAAAVPLYRFTRKRHFDDIKDDIAYLHAKLFADGIFEGGLERSIFDHAS